MIEADLHRLADYPILSALARLHTAAKALDGRACAFVYKSHLARIDWLSMAEAERSFACALGVKPPEPP
jgi:hypothetical protein